ncbi:unnamed protein product [Ectocarpus sp. CCAP 1310/34]|nr:unnamed protein product [Ectocarpus sp. CCAP 1310/34]
MHISEATLTFWRMPCAASTEGDASWLEGRRKYDKKDN